MTSVSNLQSIHSNLSSLGKGLLEIKRARQLAQNLREEEGLQLQIENAPLVAKKIIAGLPDFLLNAASSGHSVVYILCRSVCEPWESKFPNYTPAPRGFNFNDLSNYKIRKYLQGTIRHVALWGLRQQLHVSLSSFDENQLRYWTSKETMIPIYRPGIPKMDCFHCGAVYLTFYW